MSAVPLPSELQPTLFDPLPPIQPVKARKHETVREQFLRFHAQNPEVYARLRDVSLAMRRRGLSHWGGRAAYEIVRFQGLLSTSGGGYKLPNVFAPHYTRLLMEQEPELEGFFKICALRRA